MANVLYLVHRLPYPPNKGDKVRSYHVLRHLAERHNVFLGTFTETSDDERHLPTLRSMCADVFAARLHPFSARLASLRGLFRGEPLTLSYYRNAALARWVDGVVLKHRIDTTLAFSSSMAQYAQSHASGRTLIDFVDVDSAKWSSYAESHRWPLSWLYRREGDRLLAYERRVAIRSTRAFFVTDKESQLFCQLAPECASVVATLCNGVDTSFFASEPDRASPFEADEIPLVFTGAMDYWPNVDAVTWFASEILPELRRRWSKARLHIVGRDPTAAVLALASPNVRVSGTVLDVRPYLQHAAVVVASLRLARGIQNKILEAMAMARPVVASASCAEALEVGANEGLIAATTVDDYVRAIDALLGARELAEHMGQAARRCVLERYTWDAHLSGLDQYVPGDSSTSKGR